MKSPRSNTACIAWLRAGCRDWIWAWRSTKRTAPLSAVLTRSSPDMNVSASTDRRCRPRGADCLPDDGAVAGFQAGADPGSGVDDAEGADDRVRADRQGQVRDLPPRQLADHGPGIELKGRRELRFAHSHLAGSNRADMPYLAGAGPGGPHDRASGRGL